MTDESRLQFSRREALCCGFAAGAAAFMAASHGAVAADSAPITRAIPSTGERLPVVGLGTDKFRRDEAGAVQTEIARLQQLGGTVIDTAAAYGDSEALIGAAVATLGIRDRLFIA